MLRVPSTAHGYGSTDELVVQLEISWNRSSRQIVAFNRQLFTNELGTTAFLCQDEPFELATLSTFSMTDNDRSITLTPDKEPVPFCMIPPTSTSFYLRLLDTHYEEIDWKECIDGGIKHIKLQSQTDPSKHYRFGVKISLLKQTVSLSSMLFHLVPTFIVHNQLSHDIHLQHSGSHQYQTFVRAAASELLLSFSEPPHCSEIRLSVEPYEFWSSAVPFDRATQCVISVSRPRRPTDDDQCCRLVCVKAIVDSDNITHLVISHCSKKPYLIENRSSCTVMYAQRGFEDRAGCVLPNQMDDFTWSEWTRPKILTIHVNPGESRQGFGRWIDVELDVGSNMSAVDVIGAATGAGDNYTLVYAITDTDKNECRRRLVIAERESERCVDFSRLSSMMMQKQKGHAVSDQVQTYIVYENHRRPTAFQDFSPKYLLPTDPPPWTNLEGKRQAKESVELPSDDWKWLAGWSLKTDVAMYDRDGWEYAFNWERNWTPRSSALMFVRRRCWVRPAQYERRSFEQSIVQQVDGDNDEWEVVAASGQSTYSLAVSMVSLALWDDGAPMLRLVATENVLSVAELNDPLKISSKWTYKLAVRDFQLDNHLASSDYDVLLAKEFSSKHDKKERKFAQIQIVQHIGASSTAMYYELVDIGLSKFVVQLDLSALEKFKKW